MKILLQITIILIVFLKTGNLLSDNDLFSVNNILLKKKANISNNQLANEAIKKGFDQLINRVLLKEDVLKLTSLDFSNIKQLVTYYNVSKSDENEPNKVKFSVTFDKDKLYDLFYKKRISYSDITDKELYILPIYVTGDKLSIFSNNFFYENWNATKEDDLVEFILPLENIETIQNLNKFKNNILDLNLSDLFQEYPNKNAALVIIEKNSFNENKIYLKIKIQNKIISKNLSLKIKNLSPKETDEKIIFKIKDEIINLVKSQNLIDISAPSFLNVKLSLDKKNNLVFLNTKIKNIDLIENIYVREFNKDYVKLKIKYLGKLEKMINQLKNENINLQFIENQWVIKTL